MLAVFGQRRICLIGGIDKLIDGFFQRVNLRRCHRLGTARVELIVPIGIIAGIRFGENLGTAMLVWKVPAVVDIIFVSVPTRTALLGMGLLDKLHILIANENVVSVPYLLGPSSPPLNGIRFPHVLLIHLVVNDLFLS